MTKLLSSSRRELFGSPAGVILLGGFLAVGCTTVHVQLDTPTLDGRYLFVPVTVNGDSTRFLVDTGATYTILSTRFATKLGLMDRARPLTETVRTAGAAEISEAWWVPVDSLKVGAASFRGEKTMLVMDLSIMSEVLQRPLDGILGLNALFNTRFTLDFLNKKLILRRSKACGRNSIPFRVKDGSIYLPMLLDDIRLDFLLDTGALVTSVDEEGLTTHDIAYAVETEERLSANVATNIRRVLVRYTKVDLSFSDYQYRDITVDVADSSVLGLDILSDGVLTVNGPGDCFRFERD